MIGERPRVPKPFLGPSVLQDITRAFWWWGWKWRSDNESDLQLVSLAALVVGIGDAFEQRFPFRNQVGSGLARDANDRRFHDVIPKPE